MKCTVCILLNGLLDLPLAAQDQSVQKPCGANYTGSHPGPKQ